MNVGSVYRVPRDEWLSVRNAQRRLLEDGPERFSRIELFRLGAECHEAIITWSGNRYFAAAIRNLNQVRRLFEYRVKVDCVRVRSQTAEHGAHAPFSLPRSLRSLSRPLPAESRRRRLLAVSEETRPSSRRNGRSGCPCLPTR